ncbi:hypothetical protein [Cognatishimia sp.]|uniref:hypothetical protein n=1 Tax=Cognatishimia sp. TaxID=2211648 RepID=UPI003513E556
MPVLTLSIGDPFYQIHVVTDEACATIKNRTIVLNLSENPINIREQTLAQFQSVILRDVSAENLSHAVLIEGLDDHPNEAALMEQVRATWPSAFDVRQEERLRGVGHYMSPKVWVGQYGFTVYHSATIPLKVGLHKEHDFCPVPGFREVHTQIAGFGKMQQCREKDVSTLYLEEPMAPGSTHRPMYDAEGNYPWHQFETITPSIFMAVEMLPDGATPPAEGVQ